jgi:hypothetical protein
MRMDRDADMMILEQQPAEERTTPRCRCRALCQRSVLCSPQGHAPITRSFCTSLILAKDSGNLWCLDALGPMW